MAASATSIGIDFGFSTTRPTFGYSRFETVVKGEPANYSIRSVSETMATSLEEFVDGLEDHRVLEGADLIALDAPVTPIRIAQRPRSGRLVDRRFSRGDFSNGKRGPQPSSIAVPAQGWPLYEAAMDFLEELSGRGFYYQAFPEDPQVQGIRIDGRVVEVLPKLTLSLLVSRERVRGRPSSHSYYWQIDNWLFPHVFPTADPSALVTEGLPLCGADAVCLHTPLRPTVCLDQSVIAEADRIQAIDDLKERHELIGAFVAGFQGALSFTGRCELVGHPGGSEGYFLLPSTWHPEWAEVWQRTARRTDTERKITVNGLLDN